LHRKYPEKNSYTVIVSVKGKFPSCKTKCPGSFIFPDDLNKNGIIFFMVERSECKLTCAF